MNRLSLYGKKPKQDDYKIVDVNVIMINADGTVNILHSGSIISGVQCSGRASMGNTKAVLKGSFYQIL